MWIRLERIFVSGSTVCSTKQWLFNNSLLAVSTWRQIMEKQLINYTAQGKKTSTLLISFCLLIWQLEQQKQADLFEKQYLGKYGTMNLMLLQVIGMAKAVFTGLFFLVYSILWRCYISGLDVFSVIYFYSAYSGLCELNCVFINYTGSVALRHPP